MKQILLFCLVLGFTTSSVAQHIDTTKHALSTGCLKKSINQKTTGWILPCGGTLLIGSGFLTSDRKELSFDDAATGRVFAMWRRIY
jgi:hypothetical protein